jgi:hypothetical protein
MKRLQTILTISLLAIGVIAYGQSYTFKVLANKGTNQIKVGGAWEPLKTGASLKDTDELKISDNAYLGLMHSGGRTLEWKQAGTYTVADLEAKVSKGSSVASKYADFLASKMTAEAKKNRLSATGAVHRGGADIAINVYAPESVSMYNPEGVMRWDALEGDGIVYKVVVKNMFDEVLITEETSDTHFNLDLNDPKIAAADYVIFAVTTADDESVKSASIALKKLPQDDMNMVNSGLTELMTDVNSETALNKYILAAFYEENNLLIDAISNYEAAVTLAPEVETFKEAYDEFLYRNGLKPLK